MGLWQSLAGICYVELTGAAPDAMLAEINSAGIALYDISYVGELSVRVGVLRQDMRILRSVLSRRGDSLRVIRRAGFYWPIKGLFRRPILVAGMMTLFFLALFLPTRVLFVQVDGNSRIPAQLIIEKADACGIRFGASRRAVRSEKMKNALLSAVPELQWAGVNTTGCVAVISVHERAPEEKQAVFGGVSSIVAVRDGIVQEVTVLRGNKLCKPGDAVKAGQVLISGYTDCGISVIAERASGEVSALTFRQLEAVSLSVHQKRTVKISEETRYSLRIGKNIINFFKDSGISDTTCVKMYEEIYVTLPGGFHLPLVIIKERWVSSALMQASVTECADVTWLEKLSKEYLRQQMVAGQILQSGLNTELVGDVFVQRGSYCCREMIGQVRSEEIIQGNG